MAKNTGKDYRIGSVDGRSQRFNPALEGLPAMVTPLDHHASTRELRRMTAEDVRRVVEHEPTWDECAEAMGVFQTLWPVLQKFQKV